MSSGMVEKVRSRRREGEKEKEVGNKKKETREVGRRIQLATQQYLGIPGDAFYEYEVTSDIQCSERSFPSTKT